jgi:hypothetical protein
LRLGSLGLRLRERLQDVGADDPAAGAGALEDGYVEAMLFGDPFRER